MAEEHFSEQCKMDDQELQEIFSKHKTEGCFMPWEEWEEKVKRAYCELVRIAVQVSFDQIAVTYAELGRRIGLFAQSDWFHLKIAWILYACAEYEHGQGGPLITALVVNAETGQPGKGFWGLVGIPARLKKTARIEDISPFPISGERDKFWVEELRRIDRWGKRNERESAVE